MNPKNNMIEPRDATSPSYMLIDLEEDTSIPAGTRTRRAGREELPRSLMRTGEWRHECLDDAFL